MEKHKHKNFEFENYENSWQKLNGDTKITMYTSNHDLKLILINQSTLEFLQKCRTDQAIL